MGGVVVCGVVILAIVALLVRNQWVYRELSRVIDEVSRLADADIAAGRDWRWRYREAREALVGGPSYAAMLLKFWRPVSSFHRGAPYLK